MGSPLFGIPLRLGVVAGESALQTSEAWGALCFFIEEKCGIPLQYQVFEGHRPLLKALKERWIDLGFIDSAWYVREQEWIRPLLQTVVDGRTEYRLLLIVQRNSIFYRTAELRGIELYLKQPHEEMAGFYAPLAFLSSSTPISPTSIRFLDTYESILKGVAYGRGMEVGVIPEYLWNQNQGSRTLDHVRILEVLPPIPTPLLVMRASDGEDRFQAIIKVFSSLSTQEEGKQILKRLSYWGFTSSELKKEWVGILTEQIRKVDALYGPPE